MRRCLCFGVHCLPLPNSLLIFCFQFHGGSKGNGGGNGFGSVSYWFRINCLEISHLLVGSLSMTATLPFLCPLGALGFPIYAASSGFESMLFDSSMEIKH